MSVGNDQLDALYATTLEFSLGVGPKSLSFRRPDVHTEDFAPPVGVDAGRDDPRDADHPRQAIVLAGRRGHFVSYCLYSIRV